jgi:hypothetical protein
VFALGAAQIACATPPASDTVFPNTTKGYIAVPSLDGLTASWQKTQIGQLMADPVMQPFDEDFRAQLRRKWQATHQRLGLTWDDFSDVPSGEAGIAVIQPLPGEHALALYADVTGREQQAAMLLAKVAKDLEGRKAKRSQRDSRGVQVTVYDVPKQGDIPGHQAAFFTHNNVLAGADNLKILEGMIERLQLAGQAKDSLASLEAYHSVVDRCQKGAGDLQAQVRWFIEPFGYAEVMRSANLEPRKKREHDMLEILRHQGFTAIKGVGGFVNLGMDDRELLHRTYVYAPPVKKAGAERFELAARMLNFPNGGAFSPPDWVPREVATYASFNLKIKSAFEAAKTLVDEYVGDEVFQDIIEQILIDPNGPQIDIRKDLIGVLGERVTVISDYHLPITPKSERVLVAIETTNPTLLAETIKKSMEHDPDARRREFNGHVIWEMVEEEAPLPMVMIENQPGVAAAAAAPAAPQQNNQDPRLPPNSAVTVANGQLYWATHIDLLIKILAQTPDTEKLSDSVDLKVVEAELKQYAAAENSCMTFSRTDEEYRSVYELFRAGRMPESETLFGKLLNVVLGDSKPGVVRQQRIDGSKLPDFETVRRYFGPAGVTIASENDGWFLTGFTLNKQAP